MTAQCLQAILVTVHTFQCKVIQFLHPPSKFFEESADIRIGILSRLLLGASPRMFYRELHFDEMRKAATC